MIGLFVLSQTFAQDQSQRFFIVDESGAPLIGASLLVQDTTTGTISDLDGIANLSYIGDHNVLISYTGYHYEVVANKDINYKDTIKVVMKLDNSGLTFDSLSESELESMIFEMTMDRTVFSKEYRDQSGVLEMDKSKIPFYLEAFDHLDEESPYWANMAAQYVTILDVDNGNDLFSHDNIIKGNHNTPMTEAEKESKLYAYESAVEEILENGNIKFVIQRLSGKNKRISTLKKTKKEDYNWISTQGSRIEELLEEAVASADFANCGFADEIAIYAPLYLNSLLANPENYVLGQVDLIIKPNPLNYIKLEKLFPKEMKDQSLLVNKYPQIVKNLKSELLGLRAEFDFIYLGAKVPRFQVFFAASEPNQKGQVEISLMRNLACYEMRDFIIKNHN